MSKKEKYRKVHFLIREDIYEKLWKITAKRFFPPTRKLHIVINEALEQYIDNYCKSKKGDC